MDIHWSAYALKNALALRPECVLDTDRACTKHALPSIGLVGPGTGGVPCVGEVVGIVPGVVTGGVPGGVPGATLGAELDVMPGVMPGGSIGGGAGIIGEMLRVVPGIAAGVVPGAASGAVLVPDVMLGGSMGDLGSSGISGEATLLSEPATKASAALAANWPVPHRTHAALPPAASKAVLHATPPAV